MPRRTTPSFREHILWTLLLDGDINENHKDGNAMATLRERLLKRGVEPKKVESLGSVLAQLGKANMVYRKSDSRRVKIIRLVNKDIGNDNPFADTPAAAEVVHHRPEPDHIVELNQPAVAESLMNGYAAWPAEKKMRLAAELMTSAYQDIAKVKAALG